MQETKHFLFLTDLLGRKVIDSSTGKTIGRVSEVIATPKEVYPEINRLVVKRSWWRGSVDINWPDILSFDLPVKILQTKNNILNPAGPPSGNGSDIHIKENFLDKQIVDVSGCKVVRV
ncbi:MAG: PRC-barrel domain-containing protein, partial [Planctomycetota bacterium]